MSNARAIDVAIAVVARLNDPAVQAGFGALTFTAVRGYRPIYDLKNYRAGLKVTVMSSGLKESPLNRQQVEGDVSIDVAVQDKIATDADCDALMLLVEQVKQALETVLSLADGPFPFASWIGTDNEPIYSPRHLQKFKVFTSVPSFTFRTRRLR